jgi:hypothetical protein
MAAHSSSWPASIFSLLILIFPIIWLNRHSNLFTVVSITSFSAWLISSLGSKIHSQSQLKNPTFLRSWCQFYMIVTIHGSRLEMYFVVQWIIPPTMTTAPHKHSQLFTVCQIAPTQITSTALQWTHHQATGSPAKDPPERALLPPTHHQTMESPITDPSASRRIGQAVIAHFHSVTG